MERRCYVSDGMIVVEILTVTSILNKFQIENIKIVIIKKKKN